MKPINQLGILFIEVPKVINGVPRPDVAINIEEATRQQILEATEFREELTALETELAKAKAAVIAHRSKCKHEVSYDVHSWPYDERFCAACDHHKGSV